MKQWALITGASSGIGLHLAACFAKDGISLLLCARNQAKLVAYYATKAYVLSFSEALAEELATKGYAAMKRNQRVYIHGALNWTMAQSMRFTPRSLATKVVKFISKPVV